MPYQKDTIEWAINDFLVSQIEHEFFLWAAQNAFQDIVMY